jgi:hypothetical protein
LAANNLKLAKTAALYPYKNWIANEYVMTKGQSVFYSNSLFRGKIPSKTIYLLLEHAAYKGGDEKNKNPSLFKHWGIKKFTQKINGIAAPLKTLEWDWKNKNIAESYRSIYDGLGIASQNRSNLISYDEYQTTRFMIIYDNSPSGMTFDNNRDKQQIGSIDVELEFAAILPKTLILVAFGISDDFAVVDGNRDMLINLPEY